MRKMSDSEWEADEFLLKKGDEDIHTANERRLSEIIGSEIGNWKLIYRFFILISKRENCTQGEAETSKCKSTSICGSETSQNPKLVTNINL